MKEIIEIFNQLVSTSGRNDKELILKKNKDNKLFKEILNFVYNPYILTGLSDKKINKRVALINDKVFNNIEEVMEYLKTNNSGRDSDISNIQHFINSRDKDEQVFLKQVFTKNLKVGITSSTINKVFGKFIPEFDVMLAKKYDEHKEKVKGNFVVTKKIRW